ncbi:MAG: riboflavin synthase [Nitrospinae bacterium]|nr:riboflavin synthase [Nitrospinota bacterium]MBI3814795.1 riboflavin synthase [Nitrospinota bacterium]
MFTGIIEEIGVVKEIGRRGDNLRLAIGADTIMDDLKEGDSVAVDGICLSVVPSAYKLGGFELDVSEETVKRTTIKSFKPKRRVNLERAAKIGSRLGGHIVTGHIDGIGEIKKPVPLYLKTGFDKTEDGGYLSITLPPDLMRYMVHKGSVAVDGISLTIAELNYDSITIAVIPHTIKMTTLGEKTIGDRVNVECDIIGKYVEKFVSSMPLRDDKINREFLVEHGYT